MTVRGGGGPMDSMAYHAVTENGSRRFGASQPMRITASWFGSLDPPHTRLWRDRSGLERELPSNRLLADLAPTAFDGAAVLGAVKAALRVVAEEATVTQRLISAITPVTIELALAALTNLEERDREIGAQWRMRIERAHYDADLAERRYEAVDPDNRLIAATLEKRWNEATQRLHDLEAELAAFERQVMRAVTAEQKRQILQLAGDFPRLWAASTTVPRDRKRIVRLLVRDITVTKGPEPRAVRLHIRWQGGATETLLVPLPQKRADATRYPSPFVERIRELAINHHDDEITALLRSEGYKSTITGKPIALGTIKWLRYKHRIQAPRPSEGTLNVGQVCEKYGVSHWVVHYWISRGIVSAKQRKSNAPYAITIDNESDRRLQQWVANSAHLHP